MKKGISKLIVNIIVLASFLEHFLDTGWYTEATLYYKGYTYWFEGNVNEEGKIVFSVYKYKSIIVDEIYTRRSIKDGDVEDYQVLVNKLFDDLDQAKKIFSVKNYLRENIFGRLNQNLLGMMSFKLHNIILLGR